VSGGGALLEHMDPWDPRVAAWLDDELERMRVLGVAALLEDTVAQVWERNVDRHDPAVAGDTATSLGITSAENLRTLLLRADPVPGVEISAPRNSVVLTVAEVDVHLMKAPDPGLGVDAELAPDWSSTRWAAASEVRQAAALENAQRYEPAAAEQWGQTFLEGLGPATPEPHRLRHLVLVWAGHPVTSATSGWLAVPHAGPRPWLAARAVWAHGPGEVPRPPEPPVVALPMARPPLDIALAPRRSPS